MANIDELLNKTFARDISAKTILVALEKAEETKTQYLQEGWELVKETPLNERVKLTFRKVK